MIKLILERNGKTAILNWDLDLSTGINVPNLSFWIGDDHHSFRFEVPLDTLRGKLNELEMMTDHGRGIAP